MLALPGLAYIALFRYGPMYGILIAFKDYKVSKGILKSPWVGLENFRVIFQDAEFYKVLGNTMIINLMIILCSMVFTVFLSLMLNELLSSKLKKVIQTFVYLPNFLSWAVFSGLIIIFFSPSEGVVNRVITALGHESIYFLINGDFFRAIVVFAVIVKGAGYDTIIYMAALSGIDPGMYESAIIDGANRKDMILHITLPRLYPTMVVVLMVNYLVNLFNSNFEVIFTLYNPLVYDKGDVLSTYLYRTGLVEGKFEQSTALGLIFSLITLTLILVINKAVKKMDVEGLL